MIFRFRSISVVAVLLAPAICAAASARIVRRPAISGIADVAYYAHDLVKSRAFYRDYLGYAERPRDVSDPKAGSLTWFQVNDHQQIELRPEPSAGADRLDHVGLITSDAEGMRQYLHAQGYPVPAGLERNIYGDSRFAVQDPDGHRLEFVQPAADSGSVKTSNRARPASRIASRIRHAGFMVADLEASLKFYGEILGFAEFWRGSADDKTLSWVNLKVPDGDEYFELMLYDPAHPPDADRRGTLNHICLEVEDAVATEKILRARSLPLGCKMTSPVRTGRNGKRQINAYDPDMTRTELMEPKTLDGRPVPSSTAPVPNQKR